jgi:TrmH family RNA methyltransferase
MLADRTTRAAERITSSKNPLVKDLRQAIDRGTLTHEGFCVAETFHLLEEAVRSHAHIEAVLAADSVSSTVARRIGKLSGVRLLRLPDELFGTVSSTETSQGVVTLVRPAQWDLDAVFRGNSLVVILDGVQDPGNAGAILRAAEAFGATGAMFLKGSVNPYNPKAMRASAGSIFRLPVVSAIDPGIAIAALEQRRADVFAAMPRAAVAVADADLRGCCAFIIGSEGRGVSTQLERVAAPVRIPTCVVESLNAAVAAGILLYEASRQRQLPE